MSPPVEAACNIIEAIITRHLNSFSSVDEQMEFLDAVLTLAEELYETIEERSNGAT